ncbi:MAG: hypothetical protein R6W82_08285 [bacterium]
MEQSYAPREMVTGHVNADGFGVGWYADGIDLPGTYHRSAPIWTDLDLPRFGRAVRSGRVFAGLRNASPGFPADPQSVPPFTAGPFLFMHNGAIQAFTRRMRRSLMERIPDRVAATIQGPSDAEACFGLVRSHLPERGEEDLPESCTAAELGDALVRAVESVLELAAEKRLQASMNMALTNGRGMAFCRTARGIRSNSLYFRKGEGSVWVVSEPLDASGPWERVPDDSLLTLAADGSTRVDPLDGLPEEDRWV